MESTRPGRALIVGFDGAPPEAFQIGATPNVDRLRRHGAYTWKAQATLPTWTLQCFVSALAAVPAGAYELVSEYPERWLEPRTYPVPSLFEVAHRAGLRTAMFNNWRKLDELPRPGTVDRLFCQTGDSAPVVAEACSHLVEAGPELCFVHLGEPDKAGHEHGWRSREQFEAVSRCDERLGLLLETLRETGRLDETLVVVLSDHGGGEETNFLHGRVEDPAYSHPLNTTIPWVCCGPGVKEGHEIAVAVSICDTAPTVAFLLGLELPTSWQGTVVREALSGP